MMSSGGLTAADLFQGKDAILSGPAGGVVGAGRDGARGRLRRASSASTWAAPRPTSSHYDGDYERAFETEVAGVRMRAPMMRIHTVAAGGGSILHFDGARFRVGPGIGRRRSRARPATAAAVRSPSPTPMSWSASSCRTLFPEDLRAGGRTRRSTRQSCEPDFDDARGRDRRRRARAGGGRRRLPADRGREHGERDQEDLRRSAATTSRDMRSNCFRRRRRPACLPGRRRARHGDGADPSALRRCSRPMAWASPTSAPRASRRVEEPLGASRAGRDRARRPTELASGGRTREVAGQGVAARRHRQSHVRAHVRYDGTDTALRGAGRSHARREAAVRDCRHANARLRGRAPRAVRLHRRGQGARRRSGLGRGGRRRRASSTSRSRRSAARRPSPPTQTRFFSQGGWHEAAVFTGASSSGPGRPCRGPALIIEPHQTIVVEPGWQAELTAHDHVVLDRVVALPRSAARSAPRPTR